MYTRSSNPKFYPIHILCQWVVHKKCVLQMLHLTSTLKTLSDSIINHTMGSSDKINKSLQLCFSIYCFHDFVTKSVQNNPNLKLSKISTK